MKIIANESLIKRNRRIGQYATFASLAILAVGLYISFANTALILYAYLALILGFILSQIGIYFSNRWGRSPRPDELLTQGLKGLDDRYTLYHYTTPVSHLLLGPNGLWILLPYAQKGKITFEKNRYRQKGGNWYLKIFGQEGLGRPDLDANTQIADLKKALIKIMPEENLPPLNPLLVFTNEKVEIEVEENAPIPAIPLKKIKDLIRKKGKDASLSADQIKMIETVFQNEPA